MRFLAIVLLVPVAFLVGRATNPKAASARSENRIYTLRQNDVVSRSRSDNSLHRQR